MDYKFQKYKDKATKLREQGYSYSEIQKRLGTPIAKSTLSNWLKKIQLSQTSKKHIKQLITKGSKKGRKLALETNKIKRTKYLQCVHKRIEHLGIAVYKDRDNAIIALSMLYLGEGSKRRRGSLTFGNSDPNVIFLFLRLLRYSFVLDESKFRCTLQCRHGQDIKRLEIFWSKITAIPLSQFYKAQVDPRTIGKGIRKKDYKGVCRLDYFSADLFEELMQAAQVICKGP
ncbi:MAG: hypothetical protein WDZ85_02650 [Candidatus Paceibacterota bacterium]